MSNYEFNVSIQIEASDENEASVKAAYIKKDISKLTFVEDYESNYLEVMRSHEILGLEKQIERWKNSK